MEEMSTTVRQFLSYEGRRSCIRSSPSCPGFLPRRVSVPILRVRNTFGRIGTHKSGYYFGACVWWTGTKTQEHLLEKIQNHALLKILEVFRTAPIHAREVLAHIPPIRIHLDFIVNKLACRLFSLSPSHPILLRLPSAARDSFMPSDHYLLLPPSSLPPFDFVVRSNRRTCISDLAKKIYPSTERISPTAEPPWHRCNLADPTPQFSLHPSSQLRNMAQRRMGTEAQVMLPHRSPSRRHLPVQRRLSLNLAWPSTDWMRSSCIPQRQPDTGTEEQYPLRSRSL